MDDLYQAALGARAHSHSPYSGFAVGVALRDENGTIHTGANMENASYPEGWCAETAAISHLIMAGGRKIVEAMVVADGDRLCTPCGGCRQRLAEFAEPDVNIHVGGLNGVRATFSMRELLPAAFEFEG